MPTVPHDISLACRCHAPDARYDQFRTLRSLKPDQTKSRFADVAIIGCVICDQLWLRYAVEYEAFSKSGRWARGLIDADTANMIVPEAASDYLDGLPWIIFGGSYFGTSGQYYSGAIHWDL